MIAVLCSDIEEEPLYDLNVNKEQDEAEDIYGELMGVRKRPVHKVNIILITRCYNETHSYKHNVIPWLWIFCLLTLSSFSHIINIPLFLVISKK